MTQKNEASSTVFLQYCKGISRRGLLKMTGTGIAALSVGAMAAAQPLPSPQ